EQECGRLPRVVGVAGAAQTQLDRVRRAVGQARAGTGGQRVARADPGRRTALGTTAGAAPGSPGAPRIAVGAVVTRAGRRTAGTTGALAVVGPAAARLVPSTRRLTDRRSGTRRARRDGRRGILAVGTRVAVVPASAAGDDDPG